MRALVELEEAEEAATGAAVGGGATGRDIAGAGAAAAGAFAGAGAGAAAFARARAGEPAAGAPASGTTTNRLIRPVFPSPTLIFFSKPPAGDGDFSDTF